MLTQARQKQPTTTRPALDRQLFSSSSPIQTVPLHSSPWETNRGHPASSLNVHTVLGPKSSSNSNQSSLPPVVGQVVTDRKRKAAVLKTAEHVGSNRRMPVQNPYAKPSARQSGAMYGNSKLNSDHYEFPPEDDEIENTIAMLPITHTGAFPLRPSQNASKNESQQEQFQKHVSTTIHADGSIQYPTLSWSSSPLVAVNGKSESQKSMSRAGIQYPKLPRPDRSHEDDQANHHTSLKAERAAVEISRKATHPHSTSAPEKRSRLPWNLDAERPNSDNQTSSFGDVSQQTLPNPRPDDRMPWNTVKASVKAEQARLRKPISMPTKGKKLSANVEPGMEGNQPTIRRIGGSNKIGKLFMSQEQKAIIRMVVDEGKSVFFTGSAGTGKSVLLRELITELRHKYKREGDRVAVTASTGLAACNIGGVTLHSFSGIGLGKESADELVKKILKNNKAKQRWIRSKVLVIDEISMVDGDLFDKLEHIAKKIRKNGRPFGGIQLVITGDFFQLPPVPDSGKLAKFCFEGATWPISIHHTIGLTQVFRQKDAEFANVLNEMRVGRLTPESIALFRKLSRPVHYDDDIEATELFPTRQEVDRANAAKMQSLQGEVIRFDASDGGAIKDRFQRDKLLANCMAPQTLHLKLGAQVMLIKNMDEGLVNGSLGIVKEFMNEKTFEIMHPIENIGGSESVLSDGEEDDLNNQRKRQRLLALSAEGSGPGRKWPRVRFQLADGTYRDLLMSQESWKIELPNGEVQASRSQVPLILAWALSIHKAQGQTLERVKVDLGKVFEKGQAYVALSRATCQEGLQVLRFDPKKVMAHEKVKIFYDRLYDVGAPPRNGKQGLTGAVRKHGANGARGDAADSKRWNDDSEEDEPQDLPAVYDGYQ